jgi:superfamily II DNA or RNA helicase
MQQLSALDAPIKATKKRLRDYQKNAIEEILEAISNNHREIVLVLPTGAGKTVTVAALLNTLKASKKFLALVPRRKLAVQMRVEFRNYKLDASRIKTAQSINDDNIDNYTNLDFIILDECHQLAWWKPIEKLLIQNPNAVLIGLTATPDRLNRKQFIEDKFSKIIYPVSFGQLVSSDYLCNPRYFAYGNSIRFNEVGIDAESGEFIQEHLDRECEKTNYLENVVRNVQQLDICDRKSIVFCASIKQSKNIADMLNNANIPTIHIDGKMGEKQQNDAITRINQDIHVITCAKLLIEGFDEPRIDTVILATATNSRMALVQMCGRGSRIHPDKNGEFWIVDFGDNFARLKLGLKQRFHFKSRDESKEASKIAYKPCPECGTLNYTFALVCKDCGHIFEPKEKDIKDIQDLQDLDIIEVEADIIDLYHIRQIRKIMRECYKANKLPFVYLNTYCKSKKIKVSHFVNSSTLLSAIFKQKTIKNYLEYAFWIDRNVIKLQSQKFDKRDFTNEEIKYFNNLDLKTRKKEIQSCIDILVQLPSLEFGKKFLNSYLFKQFKTRCNGRWQDVLGVLDYDTHDNIKAVYKAKWEGINKQIKTEQQIDGEFNADDITNPYDTLGNHLQNETMLLEWAYKYVNLIYNKL